MYVLFQLLGILAILGVTLSLSQGHTAHSFQHYHGPVEGPDTEVVWQDKHGHHHHDFAAHPKYEFAYGVEDHHTGDYHGQKEHRDGEWLVFKISDFQNTDRHLHRSIIDQTSTLRLTG